DAAVNDCLRTCLGVECPAPIALDERDGEWPVVWADRQFGTAGVLPIDRMLCVVERNESALEFLVSILVAGIDDPLAIRPQDSVQVRVLVIAQGRNERTDGFLGGCEAALGFGRVRGCRLSDCEP